MGYTVTLQRHRLDDRFKDWGDSNYFTVELSRTLTVQQLLTHLYVLIPALDNDKHYFVSQSEIDKLLEKGKGWLSSHPAREQITRRYLINLNSLTNQALARLSEGEETEENEQELNSEELKRQETLQQKRLELVLEQLKNSGASSVLDLGCGDGKLLRMLLQEKQFTRIAGMDACYSALIRARDRLHWDDMAPRQKERIKLFQGALTYRDKRLEGYDAAAIVEVIEHLDESRLRSFERVIFEFARPKTVVLTTPNTEYNALFDKLEAGSLRHTDHRFEWTRKQFKTGRQGLPQGIITTSRFFRSAPSKKTWAHPHRWEFLPLDINVPESSLVLLVGASGSGKSTFRETAFRQGTKSSPRMNAGEWCRMTKTVKPPPMMPSTCCTTSLGSV